MVRAPAPLCLQPLSLVRGAFVSAESQRGQFGEERYEKEEFQRKVRATFLALMEEDKVRGPTKEPSVLR